MYTLLMNIVHIIFYAVYSRDRRVPTAQRTATAAQWPLVICHLTFLIRTVCFCPKSFDETIVVKFWPLL